MALSLAPPACTIASSNPVQATPAGPAGRLRIFLQTDDPHVMSDIFYAMADISNRDRLSRTARPRPR